MASAHSEARKREKVREMLQRLEADRRSVTADDALQTRAALFGNCEGDRSVEGFECRFLKRMCRRRLLDVMPGQTRINFYVVRDTPGILRVLAVPEELNGLIWANQSTDPPEAVESAKQVDLPARTLMFEEGHFVEVSEAPTVSPEEELRSAVSDLELKEATIKVLVGMVDNLFYLRTKVEAIDAKVTHLCKELGSSPVPTETT